MARRRDDLIALCAVLAATALTLVSWHSATFRSFFAWPSGSVWPNFVQAALWVLGAGFTGWYLRDHVGRRLVGWLNRHHEIHAVRRLDSHTDNLKGELIKINQQLSELRGAVRSLHTRLDGLWRPPTRPGSCPP